MSHGTWRRETFEPFAVWRWVLWLSLSHLETAASWVSGGSVVESGPGVGSCITSTLLSHLIAFHRSIVNSIAADTSHLTLVGPDDGFLPLTETVVVTSAFGEHISSASQS